MMACTKTGFLEYASYVILERAVRALKMPQAGAAQDHACLKRNGRCRFKQSANVIGSTMQYHPHGDAAIGEATVNLAKGNLI